MQGNEGKGEPTAKATHGKTRRVTQVERDDPTSGGPT
jgi:hypothetical protein